MWFNFTKSYKMIDQEEFEKLQESILDRAYELMFDDLHLTLNEAYTMAVEEFAKERDIPLRTFKDPINGDLYVAIGEGDIE